MTYWSYHLLFTLPPLVLLLWLARRRLERAHFAAFAVVGVIVMAFTTPWDNWAVARGIWSFGEGKTLGIPWSGLAERTPFLGHIPYEEYAFFLIETALACLLTLFFLRRGPVR